MEIKNEIGVNQAEECAAVVKAVCRVIKEEFPENAAEVVTEIIRVVL